VQNLFEKDELEKLFDGLRGKRGDGNREELMEEFVKQSKKNMHVLLAMSPVGNAFRYTS